MPVLKDRHSYLFFVKILINGITHNEKQKNNSDFSLLFSSTIIDFLFIYAGFKIYLM